MDTSKRQRLAKAADAVRADLQLQRPVTVQILEDLVGRLGGTVVWGPYNSEVEASIERTAGGPHTFVIRIDETKPSARVVFSLAHEIAHLLLHMGYGRDPWETAPPYVESYARSGYTEEELEANEFAANLLMPAAAFREEWGARRSATEVAAAFGVSPTAALTRARWLGLSQWP